MQNYRTIFKKNPLFDVCPSCGEMNSLHRSRTHNWIEQVVKKISFYKIYRCKLCGWRGYLSTINLNIATLKFIAIYFFATVIAAYFVLAILTTIVL
jgi:predicted RNA-binding Zn-ribbon protein involved in translation (DUF1610 family)